MKIHQAILGYDRGHRLLATSRRLRSISKHQLLQLSDRSVDVKSVPMSGYLTGYPLHEDRMYVLACTWGAPEMPRPGCIWTHSLFVSFTELARLDDPRHLLPLFKRPNAIESKDDYSQPLEFIPFNSPLPPIDVKLASDLLSRLYTQPNQKGIPIHRRSDKVSRNSFSDMGSAVAKTQKKFSFLFVDCRRPVNKRSLL